MNAARVRRRVRRLSAFVSAAVLVCSAAVHAPSHHRGGLSRVMGLPPEGTLPFGVGIPGVGVPGVPGLTRVRQAGAVPPGTPALPGAPGARGKQADEDDQGGESGKNGENRESGVSGKNEKPREVSRELSRALGPLDPDGQGLSVAVYDTATGSSGLYGKGVYDTASIVKVDIVTALLLQAQRAGRTLTPRERRYAAAMIEQSDNAAATALWRRIGGARGLNAANRRLGLRSTRGGAGHWWGLTRTTAADQLTLLRAIFGSTSVLRAGRRAYLMQLMGHVEPDQAWGVSAAADSDAGSALKNGWLMRTGSGLWDVNSIGRVTYGGHTMLLVVLSDENVSWSGGITLVQRAARIAVHTVAGD